jgi:hypothetical protein
MTDMGGGEAGRVGGARPPDIATQLKTPLKMAPMTKWSSALDGRDDPHSARGLIRHFPCLLAPSRPPDDDEPSPSIPFTTPTSTVASYTARPCRRRIR